MRPLAVTLTLLLAGCIPSGGPEQAPPLPGGSTPVAGKQPAAPTEKKPADLERLQGTWKSLDPNSRFLALRFTGRQVTLIGRFPGGGPDKGQIEGFGELRLKEFRNPKEMDFLGVQGAFMENIYDWEGDDLKFGEGGKDDRPQGLHEGFVLFRKQKN